MYGINNAGYATGYEEDFRGNQAGFLYHNGVFCAPSPVGSTFTYFSL